MFRCDDLFEGMIDTMYYNGSNPAEAVRLGKQWEEMVNQKKETDTVSSYTFEMLAKKALVKQIKERYQEDFIVDDISVVWMAHLLGDKKAIFVDNGKNQRLYEVTYNKARNEMYLDMYEKQVNMVVPSEAFEMPV